MKTKLFLTSWPHGKLRPVEILGPHRTMKNGIYIRYLDGKGGTDTTTSNFLFDMPDTERIAEQEREQEAGMSTDAKIVPAIFSHADVGNCRAYYRTVPNGQLICTQEEGSTGFVWYSCIDDGCWEEPDFAIDTDKYRIEIVEEARA